MGSRSEAALAIQAGRVTVSGRPATKAGALVSPDEPIVLSAPPRRFVSRGGEKLDAALARFGLDVSGRLALDAGASTGGFTDCLLQRGAAAVVAVDVGYGQLDWRLRQDPRVTLLERTNVRDLRPEQLPFTPDLVTADLSFISLRLVLPALRRCAAPGSDFVLLVKPQFEVGRERVGPGGVVRDPGAWRDAVAEVARAGEALGLCPVGVTVSPLPGPAGNVEFFLHLSGRAASAPGLEEALEEAVEEARELRTAARPGGREGR